MSFPATSCPAVRRPIRARTVLWRASASQTAGTASAARIHPNVVGGEPPSNPAIGGGEQEDFRCRKLDDYGDQ